MSSHRVTDSCQRADSLRRGVEHLQRLLTILRTVEQGGDDGARRFIYVDCRFVALF